MDPVTYLCPKFPGYEIGNFTGDKKIRFKKGIFVAKYPDQVRLIESNDWFNVHIFKDTGEDDDPGFIVSKTAVEVLKQAGLDVETVANALGLKAGDRLTVQAVKEYMER